VIHYGNNGRQTAACRFTGIVILSKRSLRSEHLSEAEGDRTIPDAIVRRDRFLFIYRTA